MAQRRLEEAIQVSRAAPQAELREFSGTERLLERRAKYKFELEKDGVFSVQFSPDGVHVLIGYGDGAIQVIDSKTASLVKELRIGRQVAVAVTMLRFHPKNSNEVWASSAEGKVYAGNMLDGTCRAILTEPNNEINCLAFSLNGDILSTAGRDHAIRLYDTTTMQVTKVYEGQVITQAPEDFTGHSNKIFVVKYHPDDNNVFVSGGWDNFVGIWDRRTAKGLQRHISGPHIAGDGLDIKNNLILTASWVLSDALQLWDFRQGSLIQKLPFRHEDNGAFLYSCRFCSRTQVIAGGSGTNSIQAVRLKKPKVMAETNFKQHVFTLDIDRSGQQVAVGGAGKKVLLLKSC